MDFIKIENCLLKLFKKLEIKSQRVSIFILQVINKGLQSGFIKNS